MNPPDATLTTYVVMAVATGVIGALSFLVRNAFSKVETTLETIGGKLDGLKADMAKGDGDRRVIEARLEALTSRFEKLEREMRDLSEGVAR